jgi:hypothetical protein
MPGHSGVLRSVSIESDWLRLATSAYAVCMPKRTKVVPIEEEKYRLIAMDERAHRVIFDIGGQRFAIDLLSRVSLLPPAMGARPANVLPMKKK